jgi:dipeptidyl aminopeptidase/acylaminoacyl peptidase
VVYPDSHHGGWKKQFNRDYSKRALAWMDKYVKKEPVITETVNSKASNK